MPARWSGPTPSPAAGRGRGVRYFDLIDVVLATGAPPTDMPWLGPEHGRILSMCRGPVAVADVASDIDLPLAVVRVLLSDLNQEGLIEVKTMAPRRRVTDQQLLRQVLDGLHAL